MKLRSLAGLLGVTAAFITKAGIPFTFDHLNSGDPANLASRAGIRFEPAIYAPDLDADGIEIPGTETWRVDYSAPVLTVTNPEIYGGGPAPSPEFALDAFLQPALVVLPGAGDLATFKVVLDGNDFGDLLDILFLDANGAVLLSLPVDQSQPYFTVDSGPVFGAASILLPAGASYDNIVVPEANTSAAIAAIGAVLSGQIWRRRAVRPA